MSKIIVRQAGSAFEAQRIAQGMENEGAEVFSITGAAYRGHPQIRTYFYVWGKVEDETQIDRVNRGIESERTRVEGSG